MAPRFCPVGDLRYPVRAPKHRRLDSSIDAATVNSKIDFLRCMGLAESTGQQGLKCALCHQIKCICDIRTSSVEDIVMSAQNEGSDILLKPCRVLINCVPCKVCKRWFKCETDVRDHMKKRHKHRLKVTLKFDNETVSTKWIKKSHLKRHRRNSDSNAECSEDYQVSGIEENSVETIRNVSKSNSNVDRTKPALERGPCSPPSFDPSSFDCCVENNSRPWYDNNNNNKTSKTCTPKESIKKSSASNTISCQTPAWIQGSSIDLVNNRIEEKELITLDDSEDLSDDIIEIPIPPCYDLTDDESYKSDDDEVQKILEVRKNQLPFIIPKREFNDSEDKGLSISDAIRDLMVAENSLSNQGDSEVPAPSRNFYDEDLVLIQDNDDEEDDFTLRFDDSEESCTFVIKDTNKEYSKSYSDDFLEETHMEMAIDHHDALEQSSNFWQTPTKDVERFSAFDETIDYVGRRDSMIAIKEELNLDHYLFDRQ